MSHEPWVSPGARLAQLRAADKDKGSLGVAVDPIPGPSGSVEVGAMAEVKYEILGAFGADEAGGESLHVDDPLAWVGPDDGHGWGVGCFDVWLAPMRDIKVLVDRDQRTIRRAPQQLLIVLELDVYLRGCRVSMTTAIPGMAPVGLGFVMEPWRAAVRGSVPSVSWERL